MKLGLGLYNHLLKPENYRFARQAGATHLVIHTPVFRHGGAQIHAGGLRGFVTRQRQAGEMG